MFDFSKKEVRGTLLLVVIVLIGILCTQGYKQHRLASHMPIYSDTSALLAWVDSSFSSIKKTNRTQRFSNNFYKKKEVQKRAPIYPTKDKTKKKLPKKPIKIKNLNAATSQELEFVNGIGKVFSERIIKYRDLLGGYHSISQLIEVYGIDSTLLPKVKKYFQPLSEVKKININTISFKGLLKHPYLSYDQVKNIMNYKQQHGNFEAPSDLLNIKSVDSVLFQKLSPYITTDVL